MIKAFGMLHGIRSGFTGAAQYLETEMLHGPSCIENCGKCCQHNTVKCTTIEAIDAVSMLTGQGKLQSVLNACESWLLEGNEGLSFDGMLAGVFVSPKIKEQYEYVTRGQCPFLNSQMRCDVHNVRPMVCHAYGVTRAITNFCPRPLAKGETYDHAMYVNATNVEGPSLQQDWESFKKYCKITNPAWLVSGFVPTLIFRAARQEKFRALVHDNRIPTAKIIGVEVDANLYWQPQQEALQRGVIGDLIVAGKY
jgi:Fe-S-cluster containining protein